jgi:hypothetical protein
VNKESEFFYLEKFKEIFPDFPDGIINPDEEPDFLIKTESKIVGIEITDYYRERPPKIKSPLQQKLTTRRKIVDLAKSIYDKQGLPPLFVHVHFNLHFRCSEREVQAFAEKIAQFVEQSLLKPSSEVLCRAHEIPMQGVDLIYIKKRTSGINRWTAPFASFVPSISPQQIQGVLDGKNTHCAKYRKKCDIIWLVLVMDRFKPSSFSLIPETTLEYSYNHLFDSAFLFFYDYTHLQKPPFLLRRA